jgi:hypothetical protein
MSDRKWKIIDKKGKDISDKVVRDSEGRLVTPGADHGYKWVRVFRDWKTGEKFEDGKYEIHEVKKQMEGDEGVESESDYSSSDDDSSINSDNFIVDDDGNDKSYSSTSREDLARVYGQYAETGKSTEELQEEHKVKGWLKRKNLMHLYDKLNRGEDPYRSQGHLSRDGSGFMPSSSTSSTTFGFGPSRKTSQPANLLISRKKPKKRPSSTTTDDVSFDYKSMYENCYNELNEFKARLIDCREKSRDLGVKLLKKETEYEELMKQLGGRKKKKSRKRKKKRKRKKRTKKRR